MIYLSIILLLTNYYGSESQPASQNKLNVICLAPAVYGSRGDSEIIEKIQHKVNSYSLCYLNNFNSSDAVTFKVRFRFAIKPSGQVVKILIVFSGTKNSEFLDCLQGSIGQILFDRLPNTDGDTVVEQSILFRIQ